LDERKGFPVAIDAFERLAGARADLRLVVAGDGPQRDAVDRLPTLLRARVTMLGAVPNQELPPFYAACDVYLGPSTGGESFGIVLIEAMAAGLPVVASDTPGYDEVVTDETQGLLVPTRDPAALAEAAARVLDDPALAARLRAAGPERARDFDWSVTVGRIEEAYRDALAIGTPQLR
jgi:phosphatidylinositol alpha-mannosyltransferase